MNISFVLPYLAERFGGPVSVVKNIGRVLTTLGHNVSYWATRDKQDHAELASMEGVHLYDIQWPRSWHRSTQLVRELSAAAPATDILYVIEFWPYSVYAASLIAHTNNIPYILAPAGSLEPWRLKNTFLKHLKKRIYLNLIGKSIMRRAACLHACSTQEAEHFRQAGYQGPITIIPNGVDISTFNAGNKEEAEIYWPKLKNRPTVLFMSRLSPEKGLDILIPVWSELVRSAAYKNAILVIAGPDDRGYQKTVKVLIDKYNAGSHIFMTGMVQGRKKLAILRRADIFVLPSYSENFGIVVAEALACGTPVITTTGTPWQQIEKAGAGLWIPPGKSELFQALRKMLDMSASQREAMGYCGHKLVNEYYNWNQVTKQIVTVCDCILHKKEIPMIPVSFTT